VSAYYNENDPFAAQWLRDLMAERLISEGYVDERDVREVQPKDLDGFERCHFFAGIGGWDLALQLAGWSGPVWTGSCPCQPFSAAGKRAGFGDSRHLWPAWFRLIRECRPPVVFGEQVASRDGLGWFDHVATDLEAEAYAIGAADLPAAGLGAPHMRGRLWWLADLDGCLMRAPGPTKDQAMAADMSERRAGSAGRLGSWWQSEPEPCSVVYGLPGVVDQLRPFGNAIVPQVAAQFVQAYLEARS
jgi:DNA (cytosine-5)-methyltransferase 1